MDQDMDLHPRDPSINHFPRSTVSDPRPSTSLPPHHGSSCPSAMLVLPQAARSLSHVRPPWGFRSKFQWRIRASAFLSRCRQIAEWVPIVSSAVELTWSCSTRQHLPQDNKQRRFLAGFIGSGSHNHSTWFALTLCCLLSRLAQVSTRAQAT